MSTFFIQRNELLKKDKVTFLLCTIKVTLFEKKRLVVINFTLRLLSIHRPFSQFMQRVDMIHEKWLQRLRNIWIPVI